MKELIEISLAFPTAVFTAFLVLCVLFWVLVIVGGLGLDMFDVDLDLDVSGADESGSAIMSLLSFVGVGSVPLTVVGTVFAFVAWLLSAITMYALGQFLDPGLLTAFAAFVVVTLVSLSLSGVIVYPLRALFDSDSGCASGRELVGAVCKITSSTVDASYGRARHDTEASSLVLSVRCEDDNRLSLGDEAVIIDYLEDEDTYLVQPAHALFGGHDDAFVFEDSRQQEAPQELEEREEEQITKASENS